MKNATTTASDDGQLLIDPETSWMSSLPEISTLDYSPQASDPKLTFGPFAGRNIQKQLSAMEDEDDQSADVNKNDFPAPPDDIPDSPSPKD